jgi:hypothetical protein
MIKNYKMLLPDNNKYRRVRIRCFKINYLWNQWILNKDPNRNKNKVKKIR